MKYRIDIDPAYAVELYADVNASSQEGATKKLMASLKNDMYDLVVDGQVVLKLILYPEEINFENFIKVRDD